MTPAQKLKSIIEGTDLLTIPTCFDALSARLVQQAGFPVGFVSGAAVAATRLGAPDTGLISISEITDQVRNICNAVPGMPVIADGDTGYGNPLNARRAIFEFARAGAACVMIEDQVTPKRCGHFDGKEVVSDQEARMKMRAVVEAAREAGILILARTDARAVHGFEAALKRCRGFEEEGADIIFLEAPHSTQELRDFVSAMRNPTMANIVPGGKSPVETKATLKEIGVKLAVYHPMLFSAIRAMQNALTALKADDLGNSSTAASFEEFRNLVGLPQYDELAQKYAS